VSDDYAGRAEVSTVQRQTGSPVPPVPPGPPLGRGRQPGRRPGPALLARRAGGFARSVAVPTGVHAPLMRNAYALMANTVVTGGLGLAYWLFGARHYEAADVGRASAAYSAMNLLAGITALSLIGAMARFIPQAGSRTGQLIRLGYLASVVTAIVGSAIFLLTTGRPGSSYSELNGFIPGLIFTAAVAIWAIFTLQDGALVGLRSARWVTLENALFGVAKIALLLPLATVIPHTGLYVSWIVPAALALPLVNWLIFRKLLPAHTAKVTDRKPPGKREVGRFLAGDVTGALMLLATVSLIPVLVAMFVVPRVNAYFYIAWTIGVTVDLLAANMALSLTVEGAFNPVRLARHAKAALRRILLILVPVAAGVALLAPSILGLFGPGYARDGAPVLVLLAAATLPRTLTEMYLGALRAQSRTSLVALIQGGRAVLVLGLVLILTNSMGIVGAGVAVLASQAVMAVVVAPGLYRVLTADRHRHSADKDQAEHADEEAAAARPRRDGTPRLFARRDAAR
jgi:O-antigen/teichoic acid export membrane protein